MNTGPLNSESDNLKVLKKSGNETVPYRKGVSPFCKVPSKASPFEKGVGGEIAQYPVEMKKSVVNGWGEISTGY